MTSLPFVASQFADAERAEPDVVFRYERVGNVGVDKRSTVGSLPRNGVALLASLGSP
jgi:hypothetical protein